jgi:hypothetical protein
MAQPKHHPSIVDYSVNLEASSGLGPGLVCPRCLSAYLHSGEVRVYSRGEDDDETAVTTVRAGLSATHIRPSSAANPSIRRQGIVVVFECEGCTDPHHDDPIELTISQHKGNTFLAWRYDPERKPG